MGEFYEKKELPIPKCVTDTASKMFDPSIVYKLKCCTFVSKKANFVVTQVSKKAKTKKKKNANANDITKNVFVFDL